MMRRKFFLCAILAGIAMAAQASPARATFEIFVYDDGKLAFTSTGSATSVSYAGTTTNFSISNGSGTSNNSGSAISFMQLSGNAVVSTTFSVPGTHTLTIVESEDGWTAPAGNPLVLSSAGGGSYLLDKSGNSISATYQAFLDTSGKLYAGGASFTTPGGGSDSKQSATATTPIGLPGSFTYSPNPDSSLVPGAVPFAFTTVQTYSFSLVAGSLTNNANASDTSSVTATPAPAGLVLALAGLPCLGIGQWLRRRRQAA